MIETAKINNRNKVLSNTSIQVKILGLVIMLIVLIDILLTTAFLVFDYRKDLKEVESIARQTAQTLSYMPVIQESLITGDRQEETLSILENISSDVNASAIVLRNRENVFLSNASEAVLKQLEEAKEEGQALVFGNGYVNKIGKGADGLLVGTEAVVVDYGRYGKIEGTVSVVYKMEQVRQEVIAGAKTVSFVAIGALLFGVFGSYLLARDIRKDTLGLEPKEIANLYRERIAVFQAIREGIIAVGADERVTMMNQAAKKMLGVEGSVKEQPLSSVIHSVNVLEKLRNLRENETIELEYGGRTMIAEAEPVMEEQRKIGTVYGLRDKTDLRKMAATLTEVRQYSEELRAQSHEFKNKLYVLLGLIQLEKTEEAIRFINEESAEQQESTNILLSTIQDEKIQAILLGKIAKASELKTEFSISPESSLAELPPHIELLPLLVILGNLIDNALEAVKQQPDGHVSFFVTDMGNDVIFEVTDNGPGIPDEAIPYIFKKGYSGKGNNRGYGLYNANQELMRLNGWLEVDSEWQKGTSFTVFLPKENEKVSGSEVDK